MDFSNVNGITTAASLVNGSVPKQSDLDRNAFLKLFTTQLQNQNPLEPVKNEAFIAQLAQFSTLEATTSMSDSLSNFVNEQRSQDLMQGASLIGKKVFMQDSAFVQKGGESIEGSLELSKAMEEIAISVVNAESGNVVNQFRLGPQPAGEVPFVWNGGDFEGKEVLSGNYIFNATGSRDGRMEALSTFAPMKVSGVSWDHKTGTAYLDLDGGYVLPLDRVKKISG